MAIRIFWAPPGPEADEALRRHWELADEMAEELIGRRALEQARSNLAVGAEHIKPEELQR